MAQPAEVVSMTGEPFQALEWITPDMATLWLQHNHNNRSFRPALAERYARDMRTGDWHLTGEPIQFASSGRLIDGQHRLHGVQRSGVAVRMFVTRGLPDTAQQFIDQGVSRTAADALSLSGYGHTNAMAAAARLGVLVDDNALFRDKAAQKVSHARIIQWVEAHPTIVDATRFVHCAPQRHTHLPPSVMAYSYYRFAKLDPDQAAEFFMRLGSGANLNPGSPLLALQSRVNQLAIHGRKPTPRQLLGMLWRVWNAYRKGRSIYRLPLVTRSGATELPDLV